MNVVSHSTSGKVNTLRWGCFHFCAPVKGMCGHLALLICCLCNSSVITTEKKIFPSCQMWTTSTTCVTLQWSGPVWDHRSKSVWVHSDSALWNNKFSFRNPSVCAYLSLRLPVCVTVPTIVVLVICCFNYCWWKRLGLWLGYVTLNQTLSPVKSHNGRWSAESVQRGGADCRLQD